MTALGLPSHMYLVCVEALEEHTVLTTTKIHFRSCKKRAFHCLNFMPLNTIMSDTVSCFFVLLAACSAPYTQHGSWCFHYSTQEVDWDGAATYCSNLSPPGQLLDLTVQTLEKEAEMKALVETCK